MYFLNDVFGVLREVILYIKLDRKFLKIEILILVKNYIKVFINVICEMWGEKIFYSFDSFFSKKDLGEDEDEEEEEEEEEEGEGEESESMLSVDMVESVDIEIIINFLYDDWSFLWKDFIFINYRWMIV